MLLWFRLRVRLRLGWLLVKFLGFRVKFMLLLVISLLGLFSVVIILVLVRLLGVICCR